MGYDISNFISKYSNFIGSYCGGICSDWRYSIHRDIWRCNCMYCINNPWDCATTESAGGEGDD